MSPGTALASHVALAIASFEDTIMTLVRSFILEPLVNSGPTLQSLQQQINALSGQL